MQWQKLGRIFDPTDFCGNSSIAHSMLPTPLHVSKDVYRIFYSGRDKLNRSYVSYFEYDIVKRLAIFHAKEPVLEHGQLGTFDDNGVTPTCALRINVNKILLYYVGWKPRSTTRFGLIAGLAQSEDGGRSFKRVSKGPILNPNNKEPISILTAPFVMKANDGWKMWYVSGVRWENPDLPIYNIKYATSSNGIEWDQTGIVCIENRPGETALARPSVYKDENGYRMWYGYKMNATYRIGYAESKDGISWIRKDDEVGITVSPTGWDSEMIEYGYIFPHHNDLYMLYNGNDYGKSGIGLAILKRNEKNV
jgi:hypothetical protein